MTSQLKIEENNKQHKNLNNIYINTRKNHLSLDILISIYYFIYVN